MIDFFVFLVRYSGLVYIKKFSHCSFFCFLTLIVSTGVMILQMLVVALIIAPFIFFSLAWAYFETYYFGNLPGQVNDTYNSLAFDLDLLPLHCAFTRLCPKGKRKFWFSFV